MKIYPNMDWKMKKSFCYRSAGFIICILFLSGFYGISSASDQNRATYVGTEACKECHEAEYDNFKAYAKKATSYESIKKMQKGLTMKN